MASTENTIRLLGLLKQSLPHVQTDEDLAKAIQEVLAGKEPGLPADLTINISCDFTREFALKVADTLMSNYPEHSQSIECIKWKYAERRFVFIDTEEEVEEGEQPKKLIIDEAAMLKAFALMFTKEWPKGCARPPVTMDEKAWDDQFWNHHDATDVDAFAQLALFGEVIYG